MSIFVEVKISPISYLKQKKLLPVVSQWNYAGHFKQHSKKWIIYFEEHNFDQEEIIRTLERENVPYQWKVQPFQLDPELNWNGMYQPVLVDEYCFIRNPIHPTYRHNCKHEITIIPALSFGMGDHITTQLMLKFMQELGFENEVVLDVGTGTGILGIIALKEGAKKVIAIDIDPLSVKNAGDNAQLNSVNLITQQATITDLKESCSVQYILSNVSTPVHLSNVKDYHFHLKPRGILILSGILDTDLQKIRTAFEANGFERLKVVEEAGWLAISFRKID